MALDSVADHPRPWVDHYPEGITWDVALDLTPVHEQVLAACDKHADHVALDFLGGKTSFGQLGKSIRAFAGALQAGYGVTKGTRVALLLPNTPFYVVAYYGVLLAGGHRRQLQPALHRARADPHHPQRRRRCAGHPRPGADFRTRPRRW